MTYKELMTKCSDIWRTYGEEGNSFLGLCEATEYCVAHIDECTDATPAQIETIHKKPEYAKWQERQAAKRKHQEPCHSCPPESDMEIPEQTALGVKYNEKGEITW